MTIDHEPLSTRRGSYSDSLAAWLEKPEWHERAACRTASLSLFFPDGTATDDEQRERDVLCAGCVVRAECTAQGQRERFGWWGGGPAGRTQRKHRRLA